MMDTRLAIMSDIHGEHRMLQRVLDRCAIYEVERLVLLGDLFDRLDQVELCARHLSRWPIVGVLGNHDRDALLLNGSGGSQKDSFTAQMVKTFRDELKLGDALFVHDELAWTEIRAREDTRVVFAGHTHFRQAKDERGPLDLSLGRIQLRRDRRYLINPGAVVDGQFAIWDRYESKVLFERV